MAVKDTYGRKNNVIIDMDQITKKDIDIILILAGLSFCICFGLSSPSLFMNDEWITTNQLNQLFSGGHLVENEGKYGRLFTGEIGAYFTTRDNYLAYSLMLPVISVPALSVIVMAGDLFRLLFLAIWFIIGTGSLLTGARLASGYNNKKLEYLFLLLLAGFFILFLLNLYYYQPFESSWEDSPVESAAIIFTNTILFSLIPAMIYTTFRLTRLSELTSVAGSLSVICCSSYLFWAGSAKDHLLVAFLITLLVFVFTITQVKRSSLHTLLLFMVGGLICWARPEYGAFILLGLVIFEIVSSLTRGREKGINLLNIIKDRELFAGVAGLLIGLLPFFINNIIATRNPFIPPQYLYVSASRTNVTSVVQNLDSDPGNILSHASQYLGQFISFFSPDTFDPVDVFRLLWISPNNSIGILLICPIIIPALIYGIRTRDEIRQSFPKERLNLLLFCLLLIVLTFIAYARVIHGSTTSIGVLPDMRYFSPLYLPMGVISVILLSPLISKNPGRWLFFLSASVFVLAPLLSVGYSVILIQGFSLHAHYSLMIKLLLVLLFIITLCAAVKPEFWRSEWLFPFLFSILMVIPTSIQFIITFYYYHVKMNGYPFWQPVLQYLFTYVLHIIN